MENQAVKERTSLFQRGLLALSDVFSEIMPGMLAAGLLASLSNILGNIAFVQQTETLYGINRLIGISSGAVFGFLPLYVAYSATERFGGRPILGIVLGCIMLSDSLPNAYEVGNGTVNAEVVHLFGIPIELVGFQGGIIVALMMGWVVARLDLFFETAVPKVVRLLLSPLLTTLCSVLILFAVVGPIGRLLSAGVASALVWTTSSFGAAGYALFGATQQLIVLTGLHHLIGVVEVQLLATEGRNFLNPIMSMAVSGQSGAVLGYLVSHRHGENVAEVCIPAFISTLFGITEPAIYGINLSNKYPFLGGSIGGAVGGAIMYAGNVAALSFGPTMIPGLALCDPSDNGYLWYIAGNLISLTVGFVATLALSVGAQKVESTAT